MFVSRSMLKKNCVLIFQKKNITESNNLAPTPQKSNGASLRARPSWFTMVVTAQQTQHICITFIQCCANVEDVGSTLYKCYTNVLWLLGILPPRPRLWTDSAFIIW